MLLYRILVPLLMFLGVASTCTAQSDTSTIQPLPDTSVVGDVRNRAAFDTAHEQTYGYYFTLPLEFPMVENNDMNNALAAAGYPACKVPVATLGFGWQLQLNHVIAILSYNRSTSRPKSDTAALSVAYRAISLGIGYDLLNHPYYTLFPYLGFKFCKTKYRYDQKVADTPTLGSYLQTNLDHKELTNSLPHIDIGLGAGFQTFYMIGIRGGVLLPMGKAAWYINDNKVPIGQSPGFRYQGYLTITVGLGEGSSSKRDRLREWQRNANHQRRLR